MRTIDDQSAFLQNAVQSTHNFFRYLAAEVEEYAKNWEENPMQTVVLIWLMLGLVASIIVVAALMLSSHISQDEGVSESYDDQETSEVVREIYPRQVEQ